MGSSELSRSPALTSLFFPAAAGDPHDLCRSSSTSYSQLSLPEWHNPSWWANSAPDKGKPAVRQGRKADGSPLISRDGRAAERAITTEIDTFWLDASIYIFRVGQEPPQG